MKPRVLALFKPWGHVSRFTPEAGHPGLADLVPVRGVYPAGRLDHDSEGLLVLTDDAALAALLTDPRHGHPRTYWVEVERAPDAGALRALEHGVVVQGRRTRPARVRLLGEPPALPPRPAPVRVRKSVPTAWLEIELREGRNRQVRRMTAAVGHPTLRLVRVAVGGLRLLELGLSPGEWRALGPREVAALRRESAAPGATPGVPAPRAPHGSRRAARGRGSSGAR
ncbi:MAG TPA: pseudouridine synthase [Myxococcota bacterium]|nr:pseudouridine synthase [Myxococcota bacterium]